MIYYIEIEKKNSEKTSKHGYISKYYSEEKKLDTKENLLSNSIYMNFRNRPKYLLMKGDKTIIIWER